MIRVDESDPVGEIEPSFPYRDVTVRRGVQFSDHYDIESEVGRGKFGTVYRCKEKSSGLALAAKVVNTGRKEDRRAVEREVEIMRRLQHPRLIQLYDAIAANNNIYVILELIEGGELFERVIDDDFVLTERSCAVFMRQICEGIEFVHGQNILHLDLKPENILCLTKEGNRIKIIDFGLARTYDPDKKLQVLFGTPEFVAPEVVNFDQIGFGTDMWSIGVICYVLLSGLSPFMGDTDVETMANVTIAKYDFDDEAFAEISQEAKNFIKSLLVKDKGGRASATQCRAHPWLRRKSTPALAPRQKNPPLQPEVPSVAPAAKDIQARNGARDELEVAKDNLRLFVERWREHPDSPYAVDGPGCRPDCTSDLADSLVAGLESVSTRGQSPSPCGSLCSSVDSANPIESGLNMLTVPGAGPRGPYLDRRASEGTAISHDPATQIVLAEEIIKLSEHLRAMALAPRIGTGNPSALGEGTATSSPSSSTTVTESAGIGNHIEASSTKKSGKIERNNGTMATSRHEPNAPSPTNRVPEQPEISRANEISEKLSRIVTQRKTNGTSFGGVGRFTKNQNDLGDNDSPCTSFGPKTSVTRTRRFPEKTESHIKSPGSLDTRRAFSNSTSTTTTTSTNDDASWRTRGTSARTKCFSTFSSSSSTSEYNNAESPRLTVTTHNNNASSKTRTGTQYKSDPISIERKSSSSSQGQKEIDMTPPWRKAKLHRFSETCRDVPRISNLRDLHRSLNLDEPTSTKNLLLQLLEEWDDGQTGTRPNGIGRKSVSLDWCGEESVARRSMNSLAEYFQSEQQKPPPGEPTPSVHR
ncbi:calcium/calmodulin-dependent protein kinase type II-like isoform X2 [Athalia rosae]|nr:calcium/calmodulin-dependent protein kinase type II-like isoform X2 [Athalia rosae]